VTPRKRDEIGDMSNHKMQGEDGVDSTRDAEASSSTVRSVPETIHAVKTLLWSQPPPPPSRQQCHSWPQRKR
jgi:hypothetical protein